MVPTVGFWLAFDLCDHPLLAGADLEAPFCVIQVMT